MTSELTNVYFFPLELWHFKTITGSRIESEYIRVGRKKTHEPMYVCAIPCVRVCVSQQDNESKQV